jgi:hypothetical protein
LGGSKVSAVTVPYEASVRRVDEGRVLAQALNFSWLTFARRSIGQATLCACYDGMSVGLRNIGAGKVQTWIPGNITRIKRIKHGRRHSGNQCSDEKAEESTHFRKLYMEREET